jgi:DNA helicase IV
VSGNLGPELPRALIIDRQELDAPRDALDRVCRFFQRDAPPVPRETRVRFLAVLAPQIRLVPSLATRINEDEVALVRLTAEQTHILDTLAEVPRIAVKGAAGTGKTLVALEKARRLAHDGGRVLFLCFNRPLAEFLAARAEGFTVKHFHALCRDLATAAGIPWRPPRDRAAARDYLETEPPQQLMQALDAYPDERWDAVIVDEGQDFREYWWLAVEKLLRNPKTDVLWVFFDPLQNLYGGGPTEALGLLAASLTWNCRNTARIATFASAFVAAKPKIKPGTPDGARVEELVCTTRRDMLEAVRTSLHRLVSEEKIPADRIVVLTPGAKDSSLVWRTGRFGNFTLVEFPARPGPGEVTFATLQRFKGLEADVVLLCEVSDRDPSCTPNHLYVGTSRARHVLIVAKYADTQTR